MIDYFFRFVFSTPGHSESDNANKNNRISNQTTGKAGAYMKISRGTKLAKQQKEIQKQTLSWGLKITRPTFKIIRKRGESDTIFICTNPESIFGNVYLPI